MIRQIETLKRKTASGRFKAGRLVLAGCCAALLVAVADYNSQLLRASVILDHHYERPILLRGYERLLGYTVTVEDFTIPGARGAIQMRMYTPVGRRNPSPMVLVHGLVSSGNRHEYMNEVAGHLAKLGFRVVLPTLPGETRFEMRPSDVTVIADAVRWTAQTTNQQVSLVGNSFSGGLIINAAAQASVAGDVKVIFCNSGYYDMDKIGRYFIHDPVVDPEGRPYQGDPPGPMVIASEYLDELVPLEDVPNLRAAIDGFHRNDGFDLPPSDPVMTRLTPRERAEFRQIETADTEDFKVRYRRVLETHRAEIAAISPASVLRSMNIPLYLLHSSADPVFPLGEIAWIKSATRGNPDVHVLISPWVQHVKVGMPASSWQKFLVIRFCAEMLRVADQTKPLAKNPQHTGS